MLAIVGLVAAAVWIGLRYGQADAGEDLATFKLLQHVTVFVMAVFVGFQVVWNVTAGAAHAADERDQRDQRHHRRRRPARRARRLRRRRSIVAVVATLFATINIAGGFIVTRRMLAMFRK